MIAGVQCWHWEDMTCKVTNGGKVYGITLPLENLFPKSTSLSNLMVKGCFFALFFLFCSSAADIEFGKPVTRMSRFSSSNKIINIDKKFPLSVNK